MSEERYFYEAQCWIADWGVLAYDRDPIAIQALARCLQEAHQNGRLEAIAKACDVHGLGRCHCERDE